MWYVYSIKNYCFNILVMYDIFYFIMPIFDVLIYAKLCLFPCKLFNMFLLCCIVFEFSCSCISLYCFIFLYYTLSYYIILFHIVFVWYWAFLFYSIFIIYGRLQSFVFVLYFIVLRLLVLFFVVLLLYIKHCCVCTLLLFFSG